MKYFDTMFLIREIIMEPESIYYKDLAITNDIDNIVPHIEKRLQDAYKSNVCLNEGFVTRTSRVEKNGYTMFIHNIVEVNDLNDFIDVYPDNYEGRNELVLLNSYEFHVLLIHDLDTIF